MKKKVCLIIYLLITLTLTYAQDEDLIDDNYFEKVGTIDFLYIKTSDYLGKWITASDKVSSVNSTVRKSDGQKVLQMNFRVNSVKVDDHFVSTQLSKPMEAGMQYKVSFEVAKDKFSGYSIKELSAQFSTSRPIQSSLNYNDWQNSTVTFSLDSVYNGKSMIKVEAIYTAMGGENYIHLGSINQRFKFFETTKYNLMLADETYKAGIAGAVYFVSNIQIVPVSDKSISIANSDFLNVQDVQNGYSNLIFNGGFECKLSEHIHTTTYNNPGELVAPFVRSVNEMGVSIIQSDSNDYRSVYQKEALPYMGNSLASFKAITTNEDHIYQKSSKVVKGHDYNTTYIYENHPPKDTMPIYRHGANVSFALKETLVKDSSYTFSFMIQLDKKSSYGLAYLGFHVLDSFPKNANNKLWDRLPDQVMPIKDLTTTQGWVEKQIIFKAKGREQFIAVGAVFPRYEKVRNQNFIPEVHSTCGPNDGYCYGKQILFSDSLFANYFIDNVVCLPSEKFQVNPSSIYSNDVNQVEIVFTPLLKSDKRKDSLFIEVQSALVTCLDVLRTSDAICIADVTKRDEVTLDPYEVINKKKIIRKMYRPKLQRKIKDEVADDLAILFSGENTPGFNNHVVIIVDETFDFSEWEYKLTKFDMNGGFLTFILLSHQNRNGDLLKKLSIFTNALIIDPDAGDVRGRLLKRLTLKM